MTRVTASIRLRIASPTRSGQPPAARPHSERPRRLSPASRAARGNRARRDKMRPVPNPTVTPASSSTRSGATGTGTVTYTTRMGAPRARGTWPLRPLAPGIVILVGIAVAVAIGLFGVSSLGGASDEAAAARADLLAATLGARVAQLPGSERLAALQLAARKTRAEFVVVSREGDVILDASLGLADKRALARVASDRSGEAVTSVGRARFAAHPLDADSGETLVAFVREPSAVEGAPALLRALVALTTLLIGVAAAVAWAVARDANRDVEYVARRV